MPRYVEVITRDLKDDEAKPDRRIIDHSIKAARVWLGKHVLWALCNNHSVLSRPIQDEDYAQ